MAIKCELANDAVRGPGHALIRIWGLPPGTDALEYCLERNQGSSPYLSGEGNWQAQETWHGAAPETIGEFSEFIEIHVGPEIVDPIVEQPQNVVCRLTVSAGGGKHPGALKIQRPLLSSKAHAPPKPVTPPPKPEPAPIADLNALQPDATPGLDSTPVPEPTPVPDPVAVLRIVAAVAIPVLLLAVAAWLWWDCRIPAFPGPNCGTPSTDNHKVTPPAEALPKNCVGLEAEACLAAALKGAEAGQLELARQLMQEAGGMGAVKAYIHLARMYDPETWSADKSPVERADWETAAYWYDEAARAGDREGMLGAGRLYCRNSDDPAFRSHAMELLRKAVADAPGEPGVAPLLKECEEKLK